MTGIWSQSHYLCYEQKPAKIIFDLVHLEDIYVFVLKILAQI